MADLHDSTEHYLATIFEIEEEGIDIKRARIAERLNISAPSVTEHIHRMEDLGLVAVDKNNNVSLTKEGKKRAASVIRRHRLAERLLVDIIGLQWAQAHKEADRWEHVISEEVEEKLVSLLGDPGTCPHGNPIPNKDGSFKPEVSESRKKAKPLSSLEGKHNVIVQRIGERIETNDESLNFVWKNHLIPGALVSTLSKDSKMVSIKTKELEKLDIPIEISDSMYVEVV